MSYDCHQNCQHFVENGKTWTWNLEDGRGEQSDKKSLDLSSRQKVILSWQLFTRSLHQLGVKEQYVSGKLSSWEEASFDSCIST